MGMWALFAPSFRNQLTAVFGYDDDTAKDINQKSKETKYRKIIADLPEFEKGRPFQNESGQLRHDWHRSFSPCRSARRWTG